MLSVSAFVFIRIFSDESALFSARGRVQLERGQRHSERNRRQQYAQHARKNPCAVVSHSILQALFTPLTTFTMHWYVLSLLFGIYMLLCVQLVNALRFGHGLALVPSFVLQFCLIFVWLAVQTSIFD